MPTTSTNECVCAECGHEQPTMDPCAKCRSIRVVLVDVVRNLLGENWRSSFAEPPGMFLIKFLRGEVVAAQIDDYIDAWHKSASTLPLHTYLGMTAEEYAAWLADGTLPTLRSTK